MGCFGTMVSFNTDPLIIVPEYFSPKDHSFQCTREVSISWLLLCNLNKIQMPEFLWTGVYVDDAIVSFDDVKGLDQKIFS